MSNVALRWAWKQKVTGLSKLVLVRLADHANRAGWWDPSVIGLAIDCGISERSVQYALKELQDNGLIQIDKRLRAKSVYQLLMGANRAPLPLTVSTTGANRAPSPLVEKIAKREFERGSRVGYKLGVEDTERRLAQRAQHIPP